VCSPLSPTADAVVVPPPPTPPLSQLTGTGRQEPMVYHYGVFLPVNNGGDGRSYTWVLIACGTRRAIVRLYELQDMHWVARASVATDFPIMLPLMKVMRSDESSSTSSPLPTKFSCAISPPPASPPWTSQTGWRVMTPDAASCCPGEMALQSF
jgi:hypothetical protein